MIQPKSIPVLGADRLFDEYSPNYWWIEKYVFGCPHRIGGMQVLSMPILRSITLLGDPLKYNNYSSKESTGYGANLSLRLYSDTSWM